MHRYAAPLMMIAANIPDIDVVSMVRRHAELSRMASQLHARAGFRAADGVDSAADLFAVFRARIHAVGLRLFAVGRAQPLVLDWTNVYGIRLLLPFSSRWLRLDMTDVVDPWILAMLLLAVAAPALS